MPLNKETKPNQFSSIWPIDRTLLSVTTPSQSDGNEEVLCIPQSSSITGTSLSDLVSYLGHSLVEVLPFRETVGVFYSPSQLGKIVV